MQSTRYQRLARLVSSHTLRVPRDEKPDASKLGRWISAKVRIFRNPQCGRAGKMYISAWTLNKIASDISKMTSVLYWVPRSISCFVWRWNSQSGYITRKNRQHDDIRDINLVLFILILMSSWMSEEMLILRSPMSTELSWYSGLRFTDVFLPPRFLWT